MISVGITANDAAARSFVVNVGQQVARPKSLNDALGRRLARELKNHFKGKNKKPNKMGAPKSGFWGEVGERTILTEVTDKGAVVTIGDARFRIHLQGGTIVPTGGRKMLTIPLVVDARGKRVADYEHNTGRKLFRIGNALFERSANGDRSLVASRRVSIRGRSGSGRTIGIRARSQVRAVFALKDKVRIPKDPQALPPTNDLVAALNDAAQRWLQRELKRQEGKKS